MFSCAFERLWEESRESFEETSVGKLSEPQKKDRLNAALSKQITHSSTTLVNAI